MLYTNIQKIPDKPLFDLSGKLLQNTEKYNISKSHPPCEAPGGKGRGHGGTPDGEARRASRRPKPATATSGARRQRAKHKD